MTDINDAVNIAAPEEKTPFWKNKKLIKPVAFVATGATAIALIAFKLGRKSEDSEETADEYYIVEAAPEIQE